MLPHSSPGRFQLELWSVGPPIGPLSTPLGERATRLSNPVPVMRQAILNGLLAATPVKTAASVLAHRPSKISAHASTPTDVARDSTRVEEGQR